MDNSYYDYLIVGAGIVGVTIARELAAKQKTSKILIIEKEAAVGLHASGRNSGVLHSGVYYPKNTLKAKVCSSGSKLMADYCRNNGLPIVKVGKVIVPTKKTDRQSLEILTKNAIDSALEYELVTKDQLKIIEPYAVCSLDYAIYMPDVSIIDPKIVLDAIVKELKELGVAIHFNEKLTNVDIDKSIAVTDNGIVRYGYLINAAGQYADQVAKMFGVGEKYTMIPFKGVYYKLKEKATVFSNGLIYPVPDLNRPFLGVHTVKDMQGNIYFGPTAVPVLGRENYSGMNGVHFYDAIGTIYQLSRMFYRGRQGFREYAYNEALNSIKSNFVKASKKLVNGLKKDDLIISEKVGIRPQLINKETDELVMDLSIEETENSLHILNAISPALTASFSFSKFIVDKIR